MKRLPPLPDLLKVPKRSELAYSKEELNALKVLMGTRFIFATNLGGREFRHKTIESMLSAPLNWEALTYRRDFFTELMTDSQLRAGFKKLVKELPDKDVYIPFIDMEPVLRAARRLTNFPANLEKLIGLGYTSRLYEDLRKYCRKFLEATPEFIAVTKKIKKKDPYVKDLHSVKLLIPFSDLKDIGKHLKQQLTSYLLFAYVCQNGCKPEFLAPERREGHIINGLHPYYGDWIDSPNPWSGPARLFTNPVPNDAGWGQDARLTLVTGSNSMGKSVYLRMIGLNVLLAMNGFYALADEMKLSPIRRIWPCFDFGDRQGAGHLETGQEYVAGMRDRATQEDLLLIDEPAQGTEPAAEYKLAKGLIANLARHGEFNSFIVTHDIEMMKKFEGLEGVLFKKVADYDDDKNKYKLMDGISKGGYGMSLARKLGTDPDSLKRAISCRREDGSIVSPRFYK